MKKCTHCGKEYPDDAIRCLIDDQQLTGESPPTSEYPGIFSTEKRRRVFEILLVCIIAFGASVYTSFYSLFDSSYGSTPRAEYVWAAQILREGSCLALVWYVLARRGKSFFDLGLKWSWKDFGWSVILAAAGSAAFRLVYTGIRYSGLAWASIHQAHDHVGNLLFGGGIFLSTILVQFLNPFFEELIVRAYLMTEIKYLTNSMTQAVIISTVLQTSYHFYQGAAAAFSHAATFLIFSIYYAKTNRIAPVILAHLYGDVVPTTVYWLHH